MDKKSLANILRKKLEEKEELEKIYKADYKNIDIWNEMRSLLEPTFNEKNVSMLDRDRFTSEAIQNLRETLRGESTELKKNKATSEKKTESDELKRAFSENGLDFEKIKRETNGIERQDNLTRRALEGEVTKEQFLRDSKYYGEKKEPEEKVDGKKFIPEDTSEFKLR